MENGYTRVSIRRWRNDLCENVGSDIKPLRRRAICCAETPIEEVHRKTAC
jgi:hypothetical protein